MDYFIEKGESLIFCVFGHIFTLLGILLFWILVAECFNLDVNMILPNFMHIVVALFSLSGVRSVVRLVYRCH